MPDPLRHVRALAGEIGPRGATSAAEARAAQYIAEAAGDYTHQVWLEPFRSVASPSLAWLVTLGFSLAGWLLFWVWPAAGTVAVTLAAVAAGGHAAGWIDLNQFLSRRESRNVVSVVPAQGSLQQRLVVIAHFDSPPNPPPGPPVLQHRLFMTGCLVLLAGLAVLSVASGAGPWRWLTTLPALGACMSLMTLRRQAGHQRGMASSTAPVAVLLEAGTLLARAALQHTEVWLVYTGSREPGMAGLKDLLSRHGALLSDADFVVLDRLGTGSLCYTQTEGLVQIHHTHPQLRDLLERVAARRPDWGLTAHRLVDRHTQASLLIDQGLKAVALTSNGLTLTDEVAEANLYAAAEVLQAICAVLDGSPAEECPREMHA